MLAAVAIAAAALGRLSVVCPDPLPPPAVPAECDLGVAMVVSPRAGAEYWRDTLRAVREGWPEARVHVLSRLDACPPGTECVLLGQTDPAEFDARVLGRKMENRIPEDDDRRFRWRSRVSLDFARVVRQAAGRCAAVLWLEDDASLHKGWESMVRRVLARPEPWAVRHLSKTGLVALLVKAEHADSLTQYVTHHFDLAPVDWLVDYWLSQGRPILQRLPFVGHRGAVSSLRGEPRPVYKS